MSFNSIGYIIKEGFKSIFKQKKMSGASVAIMVATMFMFGVFYVLSENINYVMEQVETQQGMRVVISDEATEDEITKLKTDIQRIDGVNTVEFYSKEDAMASLKQRLGDKQSVLEGLDEENFLPASYFVTLTDLDRNEEIQEQILKLSGVEKISSDNNTIAKLSKIARGIRTGTLVILIILVVISIAIIAYTIKLTVYARRKEIEIMKYVGATNSFVRGPFIVEGIVIGIISALISVAIMAVVYNSVLNGIMASSVIKSLVITFRTFEEMILRILLVYLVVGIGIGILGSSISMKKYLDA